MKLRVNNIYFQTNLFIPGIGMVPNITPQNAKGAGIFITNWGAELHLKGEGVWLVPAANILSTGPVLEEPKEATKSK